MRKQGYDNITTSLDSYFNMGKMRSMKFCYFNLTYICHKINKVCTLQRCLLAYFCFSYASKPLNLKYILNIVNSSIKIIHSLNGQIHF